MILVEVYFIKLRNWCEDIDVVCNTLASSDVRLNYCVPMNHRPGVIIHVILDNVYRISGSKTSTVSNKGHNAAKGLPGGQYSKMHWRDQAAGPIRGLATKGAKPNEKANG